VELHQNFGLALPVGHGAVLVDQGLRATLLHLLRECDDPFENSSEPLDERQSLRR